MAEGTTTRSKVYSTFHENFLELRGHYVYINDVTNPKKRSDTKCNVTMAQRTDAQKVIYDGAFIAAFAKWEAFVQDFLEETFEELCKHQRNLVLSPDDVERVGKTYYVPYFGNNVRSISKYFAALFPDTRTDDLAKKLLNSTPIKVKCMIKGEQLSESPFLNIGNPSALKTITQLLHGVRCILAHSKCGRTFSTGVLSEFPSKESFLEQMAGSNPTAADKSTAEQFYSLYERADAVNNNTTQPNRLNIYYCDVLNLQHFILKLSSRLHNTVVRLIKDHYTVRVWDLVADLPPSKRKPSAPRTLHFCGVKGIFMAFLFLAIILILYHNRSLLITFTEKMYWYVLDV